MAYFLLAIFMFGISVMIHVLFCRMASKKVLQARAFMITALFFLMAYSLAASALDQAGALSASSIWGLPFKITAGCIFVIFIPIYLCFYVLTQLTSPSKKILLTVSNLGKVSYEQIVLSVKEENLIHTRLMDLQISGCVKEMGGRYQLTMAGKRIADILNMMQYLLGRDMGG
jgi:hypothetical protein